MNDNSNVGAPRNLKLSINEATVRLEWEAPKKGITDERIQGYIAECSFIAENLAYTLTHKVMNDVQRVNLPLQQNLSTAGYNCCIGAVFETYSSTACIATPFQFTLDRNRQESICSHQSTLLAVAAVLILVIVILLIMLIVAAVITVYIWKRFRLVVQQNTEIQAKRFASSS